MIKIYNIHAFFLYKEEVFIFSYSKLGSSKFVLPCSKELIFGVLYNIFFFEKKHSHKNNPYDFFKNLNKFILFFGTFCTAILNGIQLKFGPRGKRTRIAFNTGLFFLKLGYSSRIPFLLPFEIISNNKEKKTKFFNLRSINYNTLSKAISHISSFRQIDPYNFGGIMLRDGFFKYKKWNSKLF